MIPTEEDMTEQRITGYLGSLTINYLMELSPQELDTMLERVQALQLIISNQEN